ncbi:unnamed protein product [Lampetra planeri]
MSEEEEEAWTVGVEEEEQEAVEEMEVKSEEVERGEMKADEALANYANGESRAEVADHITVVTARATDGTPHARARVCGRVRLTYTRQASPHNSLDGPSYGCWRAPIKVGRTREAVDVAETRPARPPASPPENLYPRHPRSLRAAPGTH